MTKRPLKSCEITKMRLPHTNSVEFNFQEEIPQNSITTQSNAWCHLRERDEF